MKKSCAEDDFLGHIGGDDFVVITRHADAEALGRSIIKVFQTYLQGLYNRTDWERGYIISKNRSGLTEQFPIASVSVAIVTNRKEKVSRIEDLSEKIVSAKKAAKQQKGDSVIIVA